MCDTVTLDAMPGVQTWGVARGGERLAIEFQHVHDLVSDY